MTNDGHEFGAVPPRDLAPARIALHHAAVLVAAVGKDLVPPEPDASHKALDFDPQAGTLLGAQVGAAGSMLRAGVRVADATLLLLADGAEVAALALEGSSLDEAEAWLNAQVRARLPDAPTVARQVYEDFPAHAVAEGAPFPALPLEHAAELARYLSLAWATLEAVRAEEEGAGPIRVWPHHFDVGVLIDLASETGTEGAVVGVGLSPGDEACAEPYVYVYPYPTPPAEHLPGRDATPGRWQREPFFGAVLTATELLQDGEAPAQAAQAFARAAVATSRALLGGG